MTLWGIGLYIYMYKIILSVRLFHVSWGHNHDVEIMKNAIKVHVKYDVQKLINILTKKRKVFLILARTQELSNDIGLIAFFQFLIFFFSFTVIFFFIFLEDGPVQHKKKSFTLNFLVNLHVCLN